MMAGPAYNLFWLGTFIGGGMLGVLPIFTNAGVFAPLEIGAGVILMIVSLFCLWRPRRIRLPRKRTFS